MRFDGILDTVYSKLYSTLIFKFFSILVNYHFVCRREKHDIPLLVQTCVDEVERRGMDETGIYRVAGVISDIESLRKAFDSGKKYITILLWLLILL